MHPTITMIVYDDKKLTEDISRYYSKNEKQSYSFPEGVKVLADLVKHPLELNKRLKNVGIVNSKDICILLSHSGETSEMIDLARYLRKRNCGILCVTNKSGSSLSRLSDNSIFLNCSNGMPGFEKIPSVSLYLSLIHI